MRPKSKELILLAPFAILGILLFAFIGGELVKLLWNWLLPPLFGLPEVTFWQALGLLALCRILFGGRGMIGRSGPRARFTLEERERFRQRMRERFGFGPAPSESQGQ
ncbi:MAG TPA: hypothetical protein VEK56_05850 [Vicinamibacterales bacterium]|nr:hypothetical protein [Vicinamibacterales bacterium]